MSEIINELIIYYRKYGTTPWFRIDDYINRESLNQNSEHADSQLYNFSLRFIDPKDNNDLYFNPDNGDDLAIIETSEALNVADDIKAGTIVKTELIPRAWDGERWIKEFNITIENRDFSFYPFKMNVNSFNDKSIVQNLTDILTKIFGYDTLGIGIATTREDLGGFLNNGVIIPKYLLLAPDLDVSVLETDLGARETLNEYLNSINYKWQCVYYCCKDTVNNIKLIQQVQIWSV